MKIISWQAVLTEHQVHLLRALGKMPGTRLKVVTAVEELAERKQQGWAKPDWSDLEVTVLHCRGWLATGMELIRDNPDAVHLFSGLWASRRFFLLLLYAVWKRRMVGLVVEPYGDTQDGYLADHGKLKGWLLTKLRPLCYGIAGKFLGKRIAPIFGISPKAVKQFGKAGFLVRNIYPFGYFIPTQQHQVGAAQPDPEGVLRLVFVGALISRKGIDTIARVASLCQERNILIRLDVYGPGRPDSQLAISPNINYCGIIPFGQAQKVMVYYDLLIVPSRYDGWGVVVNEALQQGVPVLASSKAGASALVAQSGAGSVFDPNNMTALVELVESLANDRTIIVGWKKKARAYADKLAPEIAASYMLECIEANLRGAGKPPCPWYLMDEYATGEY